MATLLKKKFLEPLELNDLEDVNSTSTPGGGRLVFDSLTSKWKPTTEPPKPGQGVGVNDTFKIESGTFMFSHEIEVGGEGIEVEGPLILE